MKKLISILICIAVLAALAVPPVWAQDQAGITVSVQQGSAAPGDKVIVTLNVSRVEECTGGGFVLDFDQNIYEYVEAESQMTVPGSQMSGLVWANDLLGGAFANALPRTVQGDIAKITLKVKQNAAPGSTQITADPAIKVNDSEIAVSAQPASLTIDKAGAKPAKPTQKPDAAQKPEQEAKPEKPRQDTDQKPGKEPAQKGETGDSLPQNPEQPQTDTPADESLQQNTSEPEMILGELSQPQQENQPEQTPAQQKAPAAIWWAAALAALAAAGFAVWKIKARR